MSVKGATGLVPSFTAYLSSTTVELEWVGVMVEEREDVTRLSDDEDAIEDEEDVGSSPLTRKSGWGAVNSDRRLLGVLLRVLAMMKPSRQLTRPVKRWWWWCSSEEAPSIVGSRWLAVLLLTGVEETVLAVFDT